MTEKITYEETKDEEETKSTKTTKEETRVKEDISPFMYDYLNRLIRKKPEIVPYSFRFGDLSNYLKISPTGHLTLAGTATTFDDLRIPGLSTKIGATPPDLISFAPATTNLQVYGFDGTTITEQVFFVVQLPHSYKEGSDITPHVHWTPVDTNSGNVKWFLEYSWANNEIAFSAPTTISVIDAADGTAWKHQKAFFSPIVGTGKTISSMLVCRLYRNPTDAEDTYGSDAAFLEIDFHFEQDTLGSQTASSKT